MPASGLATFRARLGASKPRNSARSLLATQWLREWELIHGSELGNYGWGLHASCLTPRDLKLTCHFLSAGLNFYTCSQTGLGSVPQIRILCFLGWFAQALGFANRPTAVQLHGQSSPRSSSFPGAAAPQPPFLGVPCAPFRHVCSVATFRHSTAVR